MAKPSQKQILDFWKETVTSEIKSEHYDLTEKNEWIENYIELDRIVQELKAVNTESGIRENLRTIFLPKSKLIWASKPFLLLKLLKEADFRELRDIKEIIVDAKNSDKFKEEWVEDLYNLIEKKYPTGARRLKALKALIRNILGELFGKLHFKNNPIKNSCSMTILQKMGYDLDRTKYDSFKEAFEKFKKSYQDYIGKLSPKSIPINVEIDQFFNFFHKDKNAMDFLKTGEPSTTLRKLAIMLNVGTERHFSAKEIIKLHRSVHDYAWWGTDKRGRVPSEKINMIRQNGGVNAYFYDVDNKKVEWMGIITDVITTRNKKPIIPSERSHLPNEFPDSEHRVFFKIVDIKKLDSPLKQDNVFLFDKGGQRWRPVRGGYSYVIDPGQPSTQGAFSENITAIWKV